MAGPLSMTTPLGLGGTVCAAAAAGAVGL